MTATATTETVGKATTGQYYDGDAKKRVNVRTRRKPDFRPKVVLTHEAHQYLHEAAHQLSHDEVGGLGYVRQLPGGDLLVDEVFMVPQVVSPGGVDFSPEAMGIATERAIADGRLEDMRFSWHSHVNMSVYWSPVDEGGIETYAEQGAPWLASLVINRRREMRARLDLFDVPLLGRVMQDDLDVVEMAYSGMSERVAADIEANVDVWTPPVRKVVKVAGSDKGRRNLGRRVVEAGTEVAKAVSGTAREDEPVEGEVVPERKEWLRDIGYGEGDIDPWDARDLILDGWDADVIREMDDEQIHTAVVAMSLREQGLVDPDDAVGEFPGLPSGFHVEPGGGDWDEQAWGAAWGGDDLTDEEAALIVVQS